MTLPDADVDDIVEKIFAERAKNNMWFAQVWRLLFKCPHCRQQAKELQAKIRAGDKKITELNELLCA